MSIKLEPLETTATKIFTSECVYLHSMLVIITTVELELMNRWANLKQLPSTELAPATPEKAGHVTRLNERGQHNRDS